MTLPRKATEDPRHATCFPWNGQQGDWWGDHGKAFPALMPLQDLQDIYPKKQGQPNVVQNSLTPKPFDEPLNQGGLSGDSPPGVTSLLTLAPAEGWQKCSADLVGSSRLRGLTSAPTLEPRLGKSLPALSSFSSEEESGQTRVLFRLC